MIKTLLLIKSAKMKYDESDALAVALCHAFRRGSNKNHNKSWKAFVEQFPERVISQ